VGVEFVLACPVGYEYPTEFRTRFEARFPLVPLRVEHDPHVAVAHADAVYTDVWASMGQEEEAVKRAGVFAPYQVSAELFAQADSQAIFLHCLPAHRGEEVTADVLEHPRSLVFAQAGNRLHFQKALLYWILGS
jgi:ornithine carbamoyltransferase